MSEKTFKIRVKKGDIEIEIQGTEEFVNTKFNELKEELEYPIERVEAVEPVGESVSIPELPDTLPSFLAQKGNPTPFPDITMVYAYWLYYKEKIDPFNAKDIEKCYDNARIRKSANIPRDLSRCVGKGFLIPLKEKKEGQLAYRLSKDGEKFVERLGIAKS